MHIADIVYNIMFVRIGVYTSERNTDEIILYFRGAEKYDHIV